jgi:hypothetical protein
VEGVPQLDNAQIDSAASAVSGPGREVTVWDYSALIDVGIEGVFGFVVFGLLAPFYHIIYTFLGAVAIVDD